MTTFQCPACGFVSHNPNDAKHRYCVRCHLFVDDAVPGYWMHETSGVLRPAIMAYLNHEPMTAEHVAAMRAYLRQWIASPVWRGVDELRSGIDALTSREAIDAWIERAIDAGIDPL